MDLRAVASGGSQAPNQQQTHLAFQSHHHAQQYGAQQQLHQNYHDAQTQQHHAHGYPTPGQQYSTLSHAADPAQQHHGNVYREGLSGNPMPSPAPSTAASAVPSSSTSPQLNASGYAAHPSYAGESRGAAMSSPHLHARAHTSTPLSSHAQGATHPSQQQQQQQQQQHRQQPQLQQPFSSPPMNHTHPPTHYVPQDRSLPERDAGDSQSASDEANDKAFEDAYVQFILYCNPVFDPAKVDSLDLRKNFSSPPKSDGKSFNTRTLYVLLRKLESKVIKTWTELALELGVQRPAVDQGQSSQKVQQYSVRLKRWLRASHIDAFFDHMMGKTPNYIRDIPPPHNDPFPEFRDLVCKDDDLALRALKPEFRPKRGRRRAEDMGDDFEPMSAIEPKRPHLDTSMANSGTGAGAFVTPQTSYPHSGYSGGHDGDYDGGMHKGHWLATPASMPTPASAARTPASGTPSSFRFHHLAPNQADTPSTPHPLSSVPMTPTPLSAHPDSAYPHSTTDEYPPGSAYLNQSQKMRMRRRHGTAVSSAWPGNNTTPNGKLRGRPPSNRTVKDGQFISFPANPTPISGRKEGPTLDLARATPTSAIAHTPQEPPSTASTASGPGLGADRTPIQSASTTSPNIDSPFSVRGSHMHIPSPVSAGSAGTGKVARMPLSLQVPQHVGGPVHLVTPTLTVNGQPTPASTAGTFSVREGERMSGGGGGGGFLHPGAAPTSAPSPALTTSTPGASGIQGISADALQRALAADLVRADVIGRRRKRLAGPDGASSDKGKGKSSKKGKAARISAPPSAAPTTLRGTEARDLAGALLRNLRAGFGLPRSQATTTSGASAAGAAGQESSSSPTASTPASEANDGAFRLLCAAWLGIPFPSASGPFPVHSASASKRVTVRRFRVDDDGYESPVPDDEEEESDEDETQESSGRRKSKSSVHSERRKRRVKETFDVEWDVGVGSTAGRFSVKGLALDGTGIQEAGIEEDGDVRMGDMEDAAETLEQRCKRLESTLKREREELRVLRDAVWDVALKSHT